MQYLFSYHLIITLSWVRHRVRKKTHNFSVNYAYASELCFLPIQATDSYTTTETVSATLNAPAPFSEKNDGGPIPRCPGSSDISDHSSICTGSMRDISSILSTSDLFDTPKDSTKTSLGDDIAMVEQVSNKLNFY